MHRKRNKKTIGYLQRQTFGDIGESLLENEEDHYDDPVNIESS